jgi:phosphatidylserine/phosphatidylglycerophosphate/cardiolipin synthase-like enzyme
MLPLGAADVLVTDCRPATARSGVTDPREVRKYLDAGVTVYRWEWLHAKVFVLDKLAVVGSANVSKNSRDNLDEAAVVITTKAGVLAARKFVESLMGQAFEVDSDWLDLCERSWRPSREHPPPRPKKDWSPIPEGDNWSLWVVQTVPEKMPKHVKAQVARHEREGLLHG